MNGMLRKLRLFTCLSFFRLLPVKGVKNISGKELKDEMKKKNKQLIDVCTPGEFRGNHVPYFRNISLNKPVQQASSLDENKEVNTQQKF